MVAAVVALGAVGGVSAQTGPEEPQAAGVEVTVWRRVANPSLLYVSTRPEGGSWRTLNTALDMSALSRTRTFHQSNAVLVEVPLPDRTTVTVEVTVWRRVSNPSLLYVSTRPQGGSWRTLNTALDMAALSRTRTFHQSNAVLVEVPLPEPVPEPDGEEESPERVCRWQETAAHVVASTVKVTTPTVTGSAFYVGNGQFVTAGHVVEDRPSRITLSNEHVFLTARLVGFYNFDNGDVALLAASAASLTALEWAGTLTIGSDIAIAGYPEALGTTASWTRGTVSRLFMAGGISYIQTDAASSPGNSGGPLVDACGRVAGVVSSSFVGERGSEGLHFAVAEPSLGQKLTALGLRGYGVAPGGGVPEETTPETESPDTAPASPTWQQIDSLIDRVLEHWNPTIDATNAVDAQWKADAADAARNEARIEQEAARASMDRQIARRDECLAGDSRGSGLRRGPCPLVMAGVPSYQSLFDKWYPYFLRERKPFRDLQVRQLARGMVDRISQQSGNPALASTTVNTWWRAASNYWRAVRDAMAEDATYAPYKLAECALWRLQDYSNTEEGCASAGQ